MAFVLDPQLAADTIAVASLTVCDVMIMNDARYPWAILVPRIENARELHDLSAESAATVWNEVRAVAQRLSTWEGVEKINIGALGNVVSQLHVHIVGRAPNDPAWPGPVWGHNSPRVPYQGCDYERLVEFLSREALPIT
jgi:diadenosine tetraphosphate (Ap4A) HIT family hydrolase